MISTLGKAAVLSLAACAAYGGLVDYASLQPLTNGTLIGAGAGNQADLALSYRTLNPDFTQHSLQASFWSAGYSDLEAAVYSNRTDGILEITMAPIGFAGVTLDSFYLGSYFGGVAGVHDLPGAGR